MRIKNKIIIEGDTLKIFEANIDTKGFKVGDMVKIKPEAAQQTGLDPNKEYEILDFIDYNGSVNAILDQELFSRTSGLSMPKGIVNVKYINKDSLMEINDLVPNAKPTKYNGKIINWVHYDEDENILWGEDENGTEYTAIPDISTGEMIVYPNTIELAESLNEGKEKKSPADKKKADKTNYGNKDMSDVDMVNPYELKKGIRIEMVDIEDYEKAMDKAVKKLKKDPMFYSNMIANAKETKGKRADISTEIKDKKLNKVTDKLKDKANEMSVSKKDATKAAVGDTLNKKEKASGKPKGVKEMTMTPKKSKGMKSMDVPGKAKTIKESFNLWESFKKNILR